VIEAIDGNGTLTRLANTGHSANVWNWITRHGGILLFNAIDSNGNAELWKTDGAVSGTALVHSFGTPLTEGLRVSYVAGAQYAIIQTEVGVYALRDPDLLTPVEEISGKELRITVYPNPAHDKLYIGNEQGDGSATLFSIDGRCLQSNIINHGTNLLDVSALTTGLYLLRLNIEGTDLFRKVLITP
jgi:ELWxxDGT repeat protein